MTEPGTDSEPEPERSDTPLTTDPDQQQDDPLEPDPNAGEGGAG